MRKAYRIVLEKINEGFLVTVPDFDCNTSGRDIADAMHMARDVIGLMGITLQDMGKAIPEPDTVNYELRQGERETYVDVDFTECRKRSDKKRVKKTLTVPAWLNKEAEANHINFSRVLEEALCEKLEAESKS